MAALTPVVDKLEDVPEAARSFYVQRDGKFHVDLAGAPAGFVSAADLAAANGKVVEFRDKNVALLQEIEPLRTLKTNVGDLDIPAARTAQTELAEIKKKGVTKPDDVTKLVQDGITAALKPVQDQLASISETAKADKKRADDLMLRQTISDAFTKAGGEPGALDFIVSRTNGAFVIEGGAIKAAANQFSIDKPGEPLTVAEWMARQIKEAPFAFKPSSGGGANPLTGGNRQENRAGVTIIKDPTPQQLGEFAGDVKAGKVRFEYSS